MRIVATSARVALDWGRRVLLEPWMRPSPVAQRMALVAQPETLEASAEAEMLVIADTSRFFSAA